MIGETERCENCEHYIRLKHNFKQGVGHEESHACVIFAKDKDAFIVEVTPNDMCEMFTEKKEGVVQSKCLSCKHAQWDYEEFYNTTEKQWFVSGCNRIMDAHAVANDNDEVISCNCYEETEHE